MNPSVAVTSVEKSYGKLKAVDGISFSVGKGETFGFLGPNGAGKSTTLHVLAGLTKPDAGEVCIEGGLDPTRKEVRRLIGFAPQSLALYEELSGRKNLSFFGGLFGLSGSLLAQRVDAALEFAGLSDRADTPVSKWSGGMKRRLNFACAIVHDPPVLLLDEPMVGIDPQSRNHMFDAIEKLKSEGRTIIYTTHYMEEAARLCDRIGIIDNGRMLAIDTLTGLLDKWGGPSWVVAEFDSEPPDIHADGCERAGNVLKIRTASPFDVIAQIASTGRKPSVLRVDRPNLEGVFLTLTGRKLRD
ncbi:MAG: ABC transporter ATP-binding protein [Planctomycetota bacterium]